LWVIGTLAGLAGLVIFVVCVPLDVVLNLDTSRKPRLRLRLVWLFGLISKELDRKKKEPIEKEPEEREKALKKKPKKKKRRRIRFRTALKILRTKGLLGKVIGLVRGIFGQLKIRELTVNLRVGLGRPVDTGLLFAVIGPAIPFLNLPSRYQIRVRPSFHDEVVFGGHLHGALRLQPIKLAIPLIRFVFSLAVLRVIKILVLSKWKRKK